jgi:hypothetical protein
MQDLNALIDPALGWVLVQAWDINASGQIVGWGTNPSGNREAFLLTPANAAVPVPAALPLLLGGLGALGLLARRRRGG